MHNKAVEGNDTHQLIKIANEEQGEGSAIEPEENLPVDEGEVDTTKTAVSSWSYPVFIDTFA